VKTKETRPLSLPGGRPLNRLVAVTSGKRTEGEMPGYDGITFVNAPGALTGDVALKLFDDEFLLIDN
jgi:hypothetical protein